MNILAALRQAEAKLKKQADKARQQLDAVRGWKRWNLVLSTLLVAPQLVQKIGEAVPTIARLIATATDDGPPVTLAQLESFRTKPQW